MGSPASLAIRLIDSKKLGEEFSVVGTATVFQGVWKFNEIASRPENREYLSDLIVSSQTVLTPGMVVQSSLGGEIHIVVSVKHRGAKGVTVILDAQLLQSNCICEIFELVAPTRSAYGEETGSQFISRLTGVTGSSFTALPDEQQYRYGSRPDGIRTIVVPKMIYTTYRPKEGDRIVAVDRADAFARQWQVDLVDPDGYGSAAYKMLVSEDVRQ